MRKTRILSLLLAAIMTATSLPIVATSVSAASENLLDGATVSGTPAITSGSVATNGYLHVGLRTSGVAGLGLNFDTKFVAGETYFLSFDVRSSVSVAQGLTGSWPYGRLWIRVGGNAKHSFRGSDFSYWELSRMPNTGAGKDNKFNGKAYDNTNKVATDKGNAYIMMADNYTVTSTGNKAYAKQNGGDVSDHVAVAAVSNAWTSFEVMLPGVTADVENPYVALFGVANDTESAPFDIDNIRLYTRDSSTIDGDENLREQAIKTTIAEYTFDSAPSIATTVDAADDKGKFFVTNGIERPTTAAQLSGAVLTYVTSDKAYSQINAKDITVEPAVTYTKSTALTPGIYELSGEFRDGWHSKSKNGFDDSSMKLTPTVSLAGGSDIVLAQAQLSTEWTPVSYRFVIDSTTTLDSVTFASDVKETLQFRDVSLVKVGEVQANDAIESDLLTSATKNYTTVDAEFDLNDIGTDGKAQKNGFITVDRRQWKWSNDSEGYTPNTTLVNLVMGDNYKFEAGYTYFLKFDIRHHVPTNNKQHLQFRIAGNDPNKKTYVMPNSSDEWVRDIQMELTAETAGVGNNVSIIIRRHWSERDIPVDIDNITIWRELTSTADKKFDAVTDKDNIVYCENYNSSDKTYLGQSAGKIYNDNGTALYHNFDDSYASAKAEEDYSFSYGLDQSSGVYTFTADVRVPYFHYVNISQKTVTDAESQKISKNDTAALNTFYAYNKHTAKIEFILTPVAGGQNITKAVEQEMGFLWSTIEASVIIEEGYKLTGVKVTPTFSEKVPNGNKAFNLKNASLVRHGGFVDLNTPIENPNGLLKDATKNYSDANIVGVEYDFEDYTSNNGNVAMNGYITAGRLPWYFRTGKGNKENTTGAAGWTSNSVYFCMMFEEKADPNKTYGFSIDMRKSVADNGEPTQMKFRLTDGGSTVDSPSDWTNQNVGADFQTYTTTYTPVAGTTGNLRVSVRKGPGAMNAPVDFDNLIVWEETNKNGKLDADERIIYNENFNDPSKQYIGTGNGKLAVALDQTMHLGEAKLYHCFEETYAKVSGADCALTYSGLNGDSGVYTFSAKMQVPYHYYADMRNESDHGPAERYWAMGDGNGEALFAANEHEVEVKFTLKPNDTNASYEYKTVTTTVTNAWDDVTASVIIDEGYTLEAVTVTPTFKELAKTAWGADNVTLNFKNVNLTRLGGYVPFTGAIENGELLTGADSNYTEVDTGYDFNTENFEDGKAVKNGYISVGRLPWFWNNADKWNATTFIAFKQAGLIRLQNGEQYGISFSARKGAETDAIVKVSARVHGITAIDSVEITNEWNNFSGVCTSTVDADINFDIVRVGNMFDTPIDIDNIVVWRDANKNGVYDSGEDLALNLNFNTSDGDYIGSDGNRITTKVNTYKVDNVNTNYPMVGTTNLTHLFEDNYAYGDLEYSNINDAGEGVYTFTADIQLPYHYNYDMTSITSADPAAAQVYYDLNKHDVKVTFTLSDGTSITEKSMTLKDAASSDWSSIAAAVVVNEGYTLTAVKAELISAVNPGTDEAVVPADKQVLSFRNAWLTSEALPIVEAEEGDDDNYLDQIKPTYNDNTIPSTVIEANPDGELQIGERTADTADNYLKITINQKPKATTYYVGFNIRSTTEGQNLIFRPYVNVDCDGCDNLITDYLLPVPGGESALKPVWNENPDPANSYNTVTVTGSEQYFLGQFTPKAAGNNNIVLTLTRAWNKTDFNQAFAIDDIEVWYMDGNDKVVVYKNDFNTAGDSDKGISGHTMTHVLPVSHTLYTPRNPEETMSVNYNLGLTVDESVEGKYSFRAIVKLAESTDKAAKARVYFNYSDGTYDVNYIDLSEDWSYIGRSGWLERNPKLESITIKFDSDVPVMLIKPELNIFYKYTYGKPNRGIVMVLLKKLEGKMIDPWKQVGVN